MGRIIEGLWDCKYCGSKGIGGSKRECPHCGKPRDTDTKFYLRDEVTYVDEEKAKNISRNPDWVCRFCDSLNPDTTDVCISCGASKTAENMNYFENRKKQEEKLKQQTSETSYIGILSNNIQDVEDSTVPKNEDLYNYSKDSKAVRDSENITVSKGFFGKYVNVFFSRVRDFFDDYGNILLLLMLGIALIVGAIWLFTPKTKTVTIEQISWERSIDIERYQTVDESGWSLPSGARLHESKTEIYKYESVLDHYENKTRQVAKQRLDHYETRVVGHRDLGNGYFEEITEQVPVYVTYYETEHYQDPVYRNQPIYKTKYYYEIDKWLHDRYLTTSGYDKSPYWADTSDLGSDERTSTYEEEYYILYTDKKGNTKEISMSYDEWSDMMVGDTITIKVSIFGKGKIT